MTDARSNATTYTYTNTDDRASRTDALMRTEHYEYDLNRNVVRFTDRRGQTSDFRYDYLNRRIFAGFGASGQSYESWITYRYDAVNRLAQASDSNAGTIAIDYDDLDRVVAVTTPQGSVAYTYDDDGRRTTLTVSGQPAVAYTYDAAERLTSINGGGATVSLAYDDANRRTSTLLPNGIVGTYGFDAANQLTDIRYTLANNILGDLTYAYDGSGNRLSQGGSWGRVNLPAVSRDAEYDAANELTRWGTQRLLYDANGNMASDEINTYAWDARNQLASIEGQTAASFQYDAFGRRIGRTVSGTAVSFLYDGQNTVQELAGSTPSANLLNGLFVDQFFGRTDSSGTSTYLIDAVNSTIALADSGGSISTSFTFEPFGSVSFDGHTPTSAFQFTGRENDSTGLYYYRARYYSPATARFVSEDPLINLTSLPKASALTNDFDLYSYARSNPLRWIDPQGTTPFITPIILLPQPNGNLFPGFYRQDNECSLGGDVANDRRCVKNCCQGHDDCYRDNQCNYSSWLVQFGSCGVCNMRFLKCLLWSLPVPPSGDSCACRPF